MKYFITGGTGSLGKALVNKLLKDPKNSIIVFSRDEGKQANIFRNVERVSCVIGDVRDFKKRILAKGYQLDRIVTHASAIGCYFRDPEGNPTEVFWLTGLTSWAQIGVPIDIDQSDEQVMADVRRSWDTVKHVEMGNVPSTETFDAIKDLNKAVVANR